jgi:hypothetical protein
MYYYIEVIKMGKPEIWDKLTEDAKKDLEAIAHLEMIYVWLRDYEFHGVPGEYDKEITKLNSEVIQ